MITLGTYMTEQLSDMVAAIGYNSKIRGNDKTLIDIEAHVDELPKFQAIRDVIESASRDGYRRGMNHAD